MGCKQLQYGHSAFFKKKSQAKKCAKKQDSKVKIKKTNHYTLGKGWLVEK